MTDPWPQAVVFDCDGLLVDTAPCWRQAYESIAQEAGRSLAHVDLARFNGVSVAAGARLLGEQIGETVDATALEAALVRAIAGAALQPMPGAVRLLAHLRGRVPLGVASNAPAEIVRAALERIEIADAFELIVSAVDAGADKPAPDVYLHACTALGAEPARAVAFEDSTLGATAARRAGMVVVAVPSAEGEAPDADLRVRRLDSWRVLELLDRGVAPPAAPAATSGGADRDGGGTR